MLFVMIWLTSTSVMAVIVPISHWELIPGTWYPENYSYLLLLMRTGNLLVLLQFGISFYIGILHRSSIHWPQKLIISINHCTTMGLQTQFAISPSILLCFLITIEHHVF